MAERRVIVFKPSSTLHHHRVVRVHMEISGWLHRECHGLYSCVGRCKKSVNHMRMYERCGPGLLRRLSGTLTQLMSDMNQLIQTVIVHVSSKCSWEFIECSGFVEQRIKSWDKNKNKHWFQAVWFLSSTNKIMFSILASYFCRDEKIIYKHRSRQTRNHDVKSSRRFKTSACICKFAPVQAGRSKMMQLHRMCMCCTHWNYWTSANICLWLGRAGRDEGRESHVSASQASL